jgi:hypothetical protein
VPAEVVSNRLCTGQACAARARIPAHALYGSAQRQHDRPPPSAACSPTDGLLYSIAVLVFHTCCPDKGVATAVAKQYIRSAAVSEAFAVSSSIDVERTRYDLVCWMSAAPVPCCTCQCTPSRHSHSSAEWFMLGCCSRRCTIAAELRSVWHRLSCYPRTCRQLVSGCGSTMKRGIDNEHGSGPPRARQRQNMGMYGTIMNSVVCVCHASA